MIKKTYHFAQSSPKGSTEGIPGLLRRVANSIEERKGAAIHDIVMDMAKVNGEGPNLSVYYTYPKDTKPPASDELYEMKSIQIEIDAHEGRNNIIALLDQAKEAITQLGDIEIYDVALDVSSNEKYILTVYFD